jgi:Exostosin family
MWQNQSPEFRLAVRRFEVGLFDLARPLLIQQLTKTPGDADAAYLLGLIERRQAPASSSRPALIWRCAPDGAWETDWLRLLLADAVGDDVVDTARSVSAARRVVIDNRLTPAHVAYYRDAFERGCRTTLIHLSDEAYEDDRGAYRYCEHVLRNYYSDLLADQARIVFFPLGYKTGFARPGQIPKPAAQRQLLWSFAGDLRKRTRGAMMQAMRRLPRGHCHPTSNFNSADCLSTRDYRAMMDDSIFVPCPAGEVNLESFRVYEALEAGCIPIVEKRPGFDYFTRLLGPHPLPTLTDWRESTALVEALLAADLESVRHACWSWWESYRRRLSRTFQATISTASR